MQRPPIDSDRLRADLMGLAGITDPDKPHKRRSFSPSGRGRRLGDVRSGSTDGRPNSLIFARGEAIL